MATTPCPDDRTLLPAALGEEVPPEVRAHLEGCPGCRRRVARLGAGGRAVGEGADTAAGGGPAGGGGPPAAPPPPPPARAPPPPAPPGPRPAPPRARPRHT